MHHNRCRNINRQSSLNLLPAKTQAQPTLANQPILRLDTLPEAIQIVTAAAKAVPVKVVPIKVTATKDATAAISTKVEMVAVT